MSENKRYSQARLLSKKERCQICNELAAKHVHYGAKTCFSCKAFFRRSIQNKTAGTYVCKRSKTCDINIKTRRYCQYCRYMRCIAIGMDSKAVLSEEDRRRRFRKNRESREQEEHQSSANIVVDFSSALSGPLQMEQTPAGTEEDIPATPDLENLHFLQENVQLVIPSFSQDLVAETQPLPTPESYEPCQNVFQQQECQSNTLTQEQPGTSMSSVTRKSSVIVKHSISSSIPTTNDLMIVESNVCPLDLLLLQPQEQVGQQPHHDQQQSLEVSLIQDSVSESKCPLQDKSFENIGNKDQVNEQNSESSLSAPWSVDSLLADPLVLVNPLNEQSLEQVTYQQQSDESFNMKNENNIITSDTGGGKVLLTAISIEPEIKFSHAEYNQLEQLAKDYDLIYRSVNFGEAFLRELLMCSMFDIPMSIKAIIMSYQICVERMTRIAHNLTCFESLPKTDQISILKENTDLLHNLRGSIFFDVGIDQFHISMGTDDLETINKMFKSEVQKANNIKYIDYKIFNSLQAASKPNPALETRFSSLQKNVADIITDDITTILITYIILFTVEYCPLLDLRRVNQTRDLFVRMLERYIYSKNPQEVACRMVAKSLNAMTCLQEMKEIKKNLGYQY